MKSFNPIFAGKRAGIFIQEGFFFLACFFILLFQIRPALSLEERPPVFFKGFGFLRENLAIPGGAVDWFASLLKQFWFSDWAASLCLVLCFWAVTSLTRKWMQMIFTDRPIHTIHLIPAAFLLVLHGSYAFRLSVTLALATNLAALILFIKRAPGAGTWKAQAVRVPAGLAAMVLLYWFTGGAFYYFAVLLGLYDIYTGKRTVAGVIILAASGILPAAACASVFLVPLMQAFVHNLPFENPFRVRFIGYGIPAFYLIVQGCGAFMKSPSTKKAAAAQKGPDRVWKPAVWALLLTGAAFLVLRISMDDAARSVLNINRSVRMERWVDALETSRRCRSTDPIVAFQTNLALFETGGLLDRMFAYPQKGGTAGLVLDHHGCLAWPEQASALCMRLGLLGESEHWAHEALELKGAAPGILKQLGILYLLKGEREASDRFARALAKVPFQSKAARDLLMCRGDVSRYDSTAGIAIIPSLLPSKDLVSLGEVTSLALAALVNHNPRNRMALEYFIGYNLLTGDLKMVRRSMFYVYALNYPRIPTHVQEALLLQDAIERKLDPAILKSWLDPFIFKRFTGYQQIIRAHLGDKAAAQRELQASFGDTFWYYLMFIRPAVEKSEHQNAYQ
jgi:hypothetical protein